MDESVAVDARIMEAMSTIFPDGVEEEVERRMEALQQRLSPYLNGYLSPPAAGSLAPVLATMVARLEVPVSAQVAGEGNETAWAQAPARSG